MRLNWINASGSPRLSMQARTALRCEGTCIQAMAELPGGGRIAEFIAVAVLSSFVPSSHASNLVLLGAHFNPTCRASPSQPVGSGTQPVLKSA
jgi:hypothetical protein